MTHEKEHDENCQFMECEICQENCLHDWEIPEGCINCGKEWDMGEAIDQAEYHCDPER